MKEFLDAGVDIVLTKPLRPFQLTAILEFVNTKGYESTKGCKLSFVGDKLEKYRMDDQGVASAVEESQAAATITKNPRLKIPPVDVQQLSKSSRSSSSEGGIGMAMGFKRKASFVTKLPNSRSRENIVQDKQAMNKLPIEDASSSPNPSRSRSKNYSFSRANQEGEFFSTIP